MSELTVVGGEVVYASGPFLGHAPPPLPISPSWSPVAHSGGYHKAGPAPAARSVVSCAHSGREELGLARRLAGARMAQEQPGHTLQPTALVHEACLRLVKRRYFVVLNFEESASALGIAVPTAKQWWAYARAWLSVELRGEGGFV